MKLDNCINIGVENGYIHLIDCIQHVETHAGELFEFDKIKDELDELHNEIKEKFPFFYKNNFSNGRFIFEKKN